ncbi:MAG: tetratricopeptide repeat protein [Bacteroidetes bacterium]|nr:tetratricopeptide repeat protein [Bacteroidota bacterium]
MTRQKQKPAKQKPAKPISIKSITKKDYTSYWLIAGLLLTLIVYFPSLTNGITNWDDYEYVNNPYLKNLSLAGIVKIFSVYFEGNYHPLTLLSLGVDHLIGGDSPFIFHFSNLLLHLVNTFLVFLLVKRLTQNNLLAALTFMIFGVHTLHVESVAWVAERKDVLYSFFYLVSLTVYATYASNRKGSYFVLSLLFFLLSLLAKGQAVVLVAILPFIDYLKGRKWFSIKVLSEKIPFLLLSVIFGWVALRAQGSANALEYPYLTLSERFAFASFGFTQYLIKSILPIGLSALYPYPLRSLNGSIPSFYWLFIFTVPVYLICSYFLFKRSKIYAFGLSMFFLSLLPLLQLIPVGGAIMADRYFYVPSVGLILCFAFGLLEIRNTRIRYALFFTFILVLSSQTFLRCRVWKESITLWDDVISKYDYSQVAYYNRGTAWDELKQWDRAIADFSKAIEINPKLTDAYYNRGNTYNNLGQWERSITDFSKVIEIDPNNTKAYSNRGATYIILGQWDKAVADFSKTIEIDPEYAKAYSNRGIAYSNLGLWDRAIADFTKATENNPKLTDAYYNRGIAFSILGQWDKALADFSKAIEIDPDYTKAYANRDDAYRKLHSEKKR